MTDRDLEREWPQETPKWGHLAENIEKALGPEAMERLNRRTLEEKGQRERGEVGILGSLHLWGSGQICMTDEEFERWRCEVEDPGAD